MHNSTRWSYSEASFRGRSQAAAVCTPGAAWNQTGPPDTFSSAICTLVILPCSHTVGYYYMPLLAVPINSDRGYISLISRQFTTTEQRHPVRL